MMPRAFGKFLYVNGFIFRTEAYLQWGNIDKFLGLIIMLNPGKSQLKDNVQWNKLEQGLVNCVTGELKLDDTMETVADILIKSSHPDLQGKLVISNLFNLRNSKSNDAIDTYQNIFADKIYKNALYSTFAFDKYPWVWLAWGVDPNKELRSLKQEVFKMIPLNMHRFYIPSRQKEHERIKDILVYHPLPRIHRQRIEYANTMIKQMKNFWEAKI